MYDSSDLNKPTMYHVASKVNANLIQLCSEATEAIRDILGGPEFFYRSMAKTGLLSNLPRPVEVLVVPLAIFAYGSARAYVALLLGGFEREAIIMQRQVMEYYVRMRYYVEEPRAAFYDWIFESVLEEKRFLDRTRTTQASKTAKGGATQFGRSGRIQELDAMLLTLWPLITDEPPTNVNEQTVAKKLNERRKQLGLPEKSMMTLVEEYCHADDYAIHYAIPSKVSHGSIFIRGMAEHNGTLRYNSLTTTATHKTVIVTEYVIELLAVLQKAVIPKTIVDVGSFRKRLTQLRGDLNIARPRRKKHTARSRQ